MFDNKYPSPSTHTGTTKLHSGYTGNTPSAKPLHRLDNEMTLLTLTGQDATRIVFHWDLQHNTLWFSENISKVLPFTRRTEWVESEWFALIHPEDRKKFLELKHTIGSHPSNFTAEYRLQPTTGMQFTVRHLGAPAEKGLWPDYMIGILEVDASAALMLSAEQSVNQSEKFLLQYQYPLEFITRIDEVLGNCQKRQSGCALLIVAVNNLALIINGFGNQNSEAVMRDLQQEFRKVIAGRGMIERIHRDQFGIVLADASETIARQVAMHINHFTQQYGFNSPLGAIHVTCTIVCVHLPSDAQSGMDGMDKAYIALNNARGIQYLTFEDIRDEVAQSRQQLGLANYLRKAIKEKRLRLAYQPIIESKTGKIAHYEALLRLIGDDGKISSAGALIPVAERMGLIDIIDQLVLDMVVAELKASPDLVLAFNVSNLTTDNALWMAHFTRLVEPAPDIAKRMIIEITETAAHRDLRRTAYFVASVQALGCQVALDDFGSGYTSFRQLKALSIDMVKIDGSFIKDLADNVDNRFFVKTLLDFTNGFGLTAVAECVENGETAKMLMDLGAAYMQGYYFGRPENHRGWAEKQPS